jgi:hypothetical protein
MSMISKPDGAQILYIKNACTRISACVPALYVAHGAFVLLLVSRSLRTCLFSSDATQSGQGVWPCPHQAGHGLDIDGVGVALVFGQEGGHGGQQPATHRRKGFVNLFHFLSGPHQITLFFIRLFHFLSRPTRKPSKAPLPGKGCPYT